MLLEIQITERNKNIFDDFSINIFSESSNNNYEIFTEAVFENGKKKMQPIVDSFKDIHHKKKVELIQWGIMSGISSLVYSEYLNNMKQKYSPVRMIMVPTINSVREYLNPENDFIAVP